MRQLTHYTLVFLFISLLFSFASQVAKADSLNAGLIPGTIWYSSTAFHDGDSITLYTLFFNGTDATLTGRVQFFDYDVLLGEQNFSVASNESKQIAVPWDVTAGNHVLVARTTAVFSNPVGSNPKAVYLDHNQTAQAKFFVQKVVAPSVSDDETSAPILNQVDNLQTQVNSAIPSKFKMWFIDLFNRVEAWRQGVALSYTNKELAEGETKDAFIAYRDGQSASGGAVSPSIRFIDIPLAYAKLFGLALVLFVFRFGVVFYVVAALLIALILGAIFKLLQKLVDKG